MSVLHPAYRDAGEILKTMGREKIGDIDWPAYVEARHQLDENPEERTEQALARKRAQALRYLIARKQSLADGYSKIESRVFTPEFVSELGQANSTRRALRNPWLNGALQGSSNEEKSKTDHENVLPFGPHITVETGTSH